MHKPALTYVPATDSQTVTGRLSALLAPGGISDPLLERRISRLEERFLRYLSCYPFGLWAPGLIISNEMRGVTESHLPIAEIHRLFTHFFAHALSFTPFLQASLVHNAAGWLDALQRLQPLVRRANPAALLRKLMTNEEERHRFIFFNFLPKQYGGGFNRYPGQLDFLKEWLKDNRGRFANDLRCLDAACGCGEGTYELALLIQQSGFDADSYRVHGSTLEPLELFAAAHVFFPHDPLRETHYRRHIGQLLRSRTAERMIFRHEDICCAATEDKYDVILCNGVLGGPFVHGERGLEKAVGTLAGRLKPDGVLLAADRFHEGWKKKAPETLLRELFIRCGLSLTTVTEGIAGIKTE